MLILIALAAGAIAAASLILTLSMILRAQRALNARIEIADAQIFEHSKFEARLNRHSDDIESLQNRDDVIIKDFTAALCTHVVALDGLQKHADRHCGDINELHLSFERLLQFAEDSVTAASAAGRFFETLNSLGRVPEQELREMGAALERWQKNTRLH